MHKLVLLSLLLLAGCASVGREIPKEKLASFTKGRTTLNEVVRELGPPTSEATTGDGKHVIAYVFAHAQARPESFIPIVGAFVGGADSRSTYASFTFNESGVLEDYLYSTSSTGAGYGASAGPYTTPDRTQPDSAK